MEWTVVALQETGGGESRNLACVVLAQRGDRKHLRDGSTVRDPLRERGLVPERRLERPREAPAMNVQIAAGDMWTLVSDAVAAPYRKKANGIVYRPFREPPIACWLALVWLPPASSLIDRLVQAARDTGLNL